MRHGSIEVVAEHSPGTVLKTALSMHTLPDVTGRLTPQLRDAETPVFLATRSLVSVVWKGVKIH